LTNHISSNVREQNFGASAENLTSIPSVKYPKNGILAAVNTFLRRNEGGGSLVENEKMSK